MFLGLDLGTTNVKAVLIDAAGKVLARGAAPLQFFHVGADGIEQDIEEIWAATLAAIGQLAAGNELGGVRAVGVSSQGGALQLLGGDGRPAGRVISWLDGRGRADDERLTSELGNQWIAQHTGHGFSAVGLGQALRLRRESPELLRSPNGVGFVGDVVVARLCGRRAHDATSLSIAMFYNPALGRADPELLARVGLAEGQLPDLLPVRSVAGALLPAVAQATGLPAGIPVSAAVHDQYAAALGVGATQPGDVMFGAGTAWVLLAATGRLTPPVIQEAFVCRHVLAGLYGQMLSLGNGGSAFDWTAQLVGLNKLTMKKLDALLAGVPPGCEGVRCWPFLAAYDAVGVPPGTRGQLSGLRLGHGKGHVLRAVLEGLAFELTRYLRMLVAGGHPVKRLVMGGGAVKSRVTPQLIADVTGLPTACTTASEASALGAAVVARGLVEPGTELAALARQMAPRTRVKEPGPDSGRYQELFAEYVASLPKGRGAGGRG